MLSTHSCSEMTLQHRTWDESEMMSSAEMKSHEDADAANDTASCLVSMAGYDADAESEAWNPPAKRRRRYRSQPAELTECPWIQRIFSNTPFATPLDSDICPVQRLPLTAPSPDHRKLENVALRLQEPEKRARPTPLHMPCREPNGDCKSMMAGTLMDTLNIHKLDDDVLVWGLVTILNNLLKDSHNVQATYRAYSFNHPVSSDAESQSSHTETSRL